MTRSDWRRSLRFWGADVRTDVDDEIAFHLEMRTREHMERGLDRDAAREAALRDFGDEREIRSRVLSIDQRRARRISRTERMRNIVSDLRVAARSLRKAPTFTAVAVLCIAIGVGASTAIFSAVNSVLLRPLPYPRSDELVTIYAHMVSRDLGGINISFDDFASWRAQNTTFAGMGIWSWNTYAFADGDGPPERVNGATVSPSVFRLLRVQPMLGRLFDSAEAVSGAPRVILLSHALWKRRFGGDSGILNKTITVNGYQRVVVGVMPPRFNFPDDGLAWTPFTEPTGEGHGNRGYAAAIE
ncbi:MAG TPA: ABC transporter permease, partial [Gemmatimonadaceae bacterium]|nr:ABC transporter permease [Gemmatimonadaceae bacterium]